MPKLIKAPLTPKCLLLAAVGLACCQANAGEGTDVVTLPAMTIQEKALEEARVEIAPNLGATGYTLDAEKIDSQSQGEFAPFDQTFYRFPGVAQDELDKRLHVRGEEADLQYRIDGLPLPDGLSGFGQELSTKFLDSVSLITGTLPAQFGNRTAGVVDLRTKSGQDIDGGTVSLYGGGYDTFAPSIEYGAGNGRFSGYGIGSFLHDGLGMANPNGNFRPTHDDTDQYKAFGDFSYLIDDNSRITLIMSGAKSSFQLPTTAGQMPQYAYGSITALDSSKANENQYEQAYYEILGYQKKSGDFNLQLTQSIRYSDISFQPDVVADVMFNGIAAAVDHSLTSNNLQADASLRLDDRHTLRGGLSASFQRAQVDTASTVLPAAWDSVNRVWAATPNGQPFTIVDNNAKNATLYGAYLQDEWRVSPVFTVNYGLRADFWQAYIDESQLSPRLNFVYLPDGATTIHSGYGRYFTPPPLEFVQAGDLAKYNNTTNGVDPAWVNSAPVRSERYHYFDAGINRRVTPAFQAGVDAYYKIKKYVLDEGQFGPAMIFSPNNAEQGIVRGIELTLSYDRGGFSAYGNVARSRALARGIVSGQFQFSADEIAYMQNNWYHLDHDQDWTASTGISYRFGRTKVYADVLYGSGLYGGFCNQTELPSYTTGNVGIVREIKTGEASHIKLRFDIVNVADVKYEIRDGSGIGVFAPQYLPRRALYTGISKDF